jgi:hypothetical protein
MNSRLRWYFAIVALTAVSFALAQQAAAQQRWTNDEGKTIAARFIRIQEANVVLRLADGREVSYPLSKLTAASQQQARKLAAASEPKVQGAPKEKTQPAPKVETPPDPEQVLLDSIPPPVPRDPAQPLMGAIRWDAWTGGWVTETMQKTLGPAKYHDRLPWFADVKGDGKVKIDGSRQVIMDTEIAWAASAGLDYWAFLLYPESDVMSVSLAQYLKSARRKDIRFCLVLHNVMSVPPEQWPNELARLIKLLNEPGYVTVLDGRPLVYEFATHFEGKFPQARFDELRAASKKAGLNPYYVYMGWNPAADWKEQSPKGFDAVSHYARGTETLPSFAGLAQETEDQYWKRAVEAEVPYIPLATTGWNKEPRKDNNVLWEVDHPYMKQTVFLPTPTADEIAKHLQNALAFVKDNLKTCPANAIIMYAWNEHDEGGWLVPTWTAGGKPDTARLDAIRRVLRPPPGRAEPSGDELTYLDNGAIKVGANLSRGGSIGYLADAKKGGNVVNVHDYGRWIGQSYYSGPKPFGAPHPGWKDWPWNPISAGDVYGNASRLLESKNDGKEIYVRSVPKQWALENVPGDCEFETWIALDGRTVRVRNRLTNKRDDKTRYAALDQELPAAYTVGALHRLVTYTGDAPFSNGPLKEVPKLPAKGDRAQWATFFATEHWAALVGDDDWGLGVIHPDVVRFIGGFYGKQLHGGPTDNPNGYVAPVRQEVLDHNIVYEFEYVLVLDTLEAIRKEAYKLRPKSPLPDYRFASDRRHWWFVNAADSGYPIRGHLRVKTEGDDPHMFGPEGFWAAKDAPTVYVRAAHHTKNAVAELFWETADHPGFDVNQSVRFAVVPDGKYRTYAVDLSAAPTYRGFIRRLRFDPVATGAPGEFVDIEFISARWRPPPRWRPARGTP